MWSQNVGTFFQVHHMKTKCRRHFKVINLDAFLSGLSFQRSQNFFVWTFFNQVYYMDTKYGHTNYEVYPVVTNDAGTRLSSLSMVKKCGDFFVKFIMLRPSPCHTVQFFMQLAMQLYS